VPARVASAFDPRPAKVYASGEMQERKLTDPAILTMASRNKAKVRRMSSLIDDVLDFARVIFSAYCGDIRVDFHPPACVIAAKSMSSSVRS
jgi:hypothetical protein